MSVITETKHYAACPECGGKVGAIDHLAGDDLQQVGPWFCDGCERGWMIRTNGRDVCDMELSKRRWTRATVTLVLPPQSQPIVFTLHAHANETPSEEFGANSRYFYEEHTCPTNWMQDVAEIRVGDDADPHGLFEFVRIRRGHLERDSLTGNLKHEDEEIGDERSRTDLS